MKLWYCYELPCSCLSLTWFSFVFVGPVHVHNPGTVIFSLLSEFTGRVGPTIEGGKAAERESDREDERDCPVFHPMSSPSTHLSEEERSCETDSIFFPSQEQGKDSHVSKEEALWRIIKSFHSWCPGCSLKNIILKEGKCKAVKPLLSAKQIPLCLTVFDKDIFISRFHENLISTHTRDFKSYSGTMRWSPLYVII